MVRIFKNLRKNDWIYMVTSIMFIAAQVWLDLKMPDYMSEITQLTQTPGNEMSQVLSAGGKMLLCALGSLLSAVLVSILAARIATDFGAELREKLYRKVLSFSREEISRFSTASLITRTTNDVMQVQMLIIMGLQAIVKAPLMGTWAILKIADKNKEWMISTAAAVVVLLVIVIVCIALMLPKFRKVQRLTDDLNRVMPTIQLTMSCLSLAIYWIGAALIESAEMTEKLVLFSDMIVFSQYAVQVVMAFMMLVMLFVLLPRASVSAKRILEVLDTPLSIEDGAKEDTYISNKGEIEFKNVSFRYPDAEEDVLHHISFSAHRGETVAFIGSTGSGKSTLVDLVPRFYDATEGEVLVDGVNVKDYTLKGLRNKIGYVSQKATLFSGTVRSNVVYGECGHNIEQNFVESVYTAQAAEFVEKMPGGYDGVIAQGGTNLSGGQKQCLSIARAVCRRPEILIFDDSFSALDYKTEHLLREKLNSDCRKITKLIVAQRIETIRDADRIIVLDEGRMAGCGTHEELMKNCEVYRQIAYSQLSKEELA